MPDPGNFALGIWLIGEIFACGIQKPGLWIGNTAHGIRNTTYDWNPQSSTWNPESTVWNPQSKTVLDSLTWGGL